MSAERERAEHRAGDLADTAAKNIRAFIANTPPEEDNSDDDLDPARLAHACPTSTQGGVGSADGYDDEDDKHDVFYEPALDLDEILSRLKETKQYWSPIAPVVL